MLFLAYLDVFDPFFELFVAHDALVLCSIAYLSEYKKEAANCDHIRSQLKEYLGDTARARMETDEANRRADRLAREVEELKKRYGV